jgi:hypothetical protein
MEASAAASVSIANRRALSTTFKCTTRTFERFSDSLKEVIDARVWAGIHFRTADMQGAVMGNKVAHYVRKHYFQPVQRGAARPR